jgi:hypothetical protein
MVVVVSVEDGAAIELSDAVIDVDIEVDSSSPSNELFAVVTARVGSGVKWGYSGGGGDSSDGCRLDVSSLLEGVYGGVPIDCTIEAGESVMDGVYGGEVSIVLASLRMVLAGLANRICSRGGDLSIKEGVRWWISRGASSLVTTGVASLLPGFASLSLPHAEARGPSSASDVPLYVCMLRNASPVRRVLGVERGCARCRPGSDSRIRSDCRECRGTDARAFAVSLALHDDPYTGNTSLVRFAALTES